jgi:hypothetical protein
MGLRNLQNLGTQVLPLNELRLCFHVPKILFTF